MAEDTLKKIPGGPSRLSGRGAAFRAARAKFEKSGGTDPYAKDAQFEYGGKKYNVAMAGVDDKRSAGRAAAKPGATSKPASELESNKRNPPAAPVVLKREGARGAQSAAQYMAKTAEDSKNDNYGKFSRAPLRFDSAAGLGTAGTLFGLGTLGLTKNPAAATAVRTAVINSPGVIKRAMGAAPGMGKRAMDAAKNMFSRKKPDAGAGKVVSVEETIARVSAKPKKFSELLPGQKKVEASTARKEKYEADKAYRKDMVKKQGFAKKADTARKKGVVTEKEAADMAEGYKKGGPVKRPAFLLNRFKKKGDAKAPMKMDKAKMPMKMAKAKMPMKMAKGGMVKGIDGCATKGGTKGAMR
jgi:hypothetical protein